MRRRDFLASGCAAAAMRPAILRAASFEDELERLARKHHVAGLSAGVFTDRKPVLIRGFGFADIESKRVPASDTPFVIASLTKTFAATLLMQLWESGKLDLDAPIGPFLPEDRREQPNYRPLLDPAVRVRHVLSHTSEAPPGTRYAYNGARFAALTYVAERLSGQSFRDLIVSKILDPLEMSRSVPGHDATADRYRQTIADLPLPYEWHDDAYKKADYPPRRMSASAGLLSCIDDLAKYDAAIGSFRLIQQKTQELAWTPARNAEGKNLPYGLGWFVQPYKRGRLIWHYGLWPTFSALYLKHGRHTLFLLGNTSGLSRPFSKLGQGDVLGSEFARAFLDRFD